MASVLLTERRDGVLLMGINRPAKRNAFSFELLDVLAKAYSQLEDDPTLRCGLLYAVGDHFTAGLDLAEVGPKMAGGASLFDSADVDPCQTGQGRPRTKPVVQAVQGYCLTIGIELALANDICVAHPDTKFGQIEVQRGFLPFGGATVRMPQRCGWGNAMRYLLTGDLFDGREAHRIGLVAELSDDPFARGLELAQRIAEQAPLAVQATIVSARRSIDDEAGALADLEPRARELMHTADAAEGMASFVERRKANYTGR